MIDASEPDLEDRFGTIDRELAAYGAGLDERPQLVVLNKIDLLDGEPSFRVLDPRVAAVVATSCATGEGVDRLKQVLFELCPADAPGTAEDTVPEFLEYRPRARRRPAFRILRTDRGFRVVGTPPPRDELEEALRRAGVRRGAQVEVGGEELEWQD